MHIWGDEKNDKLICSAGIDPQVEGHGGWGGMDGDRALTYIHRHV